MSPAPLLALVRRLHADAGAVADSELLDRFVLHRDQAAFELLVWRHGALVWGVCRRMLAPDWHAAEDACQAAFLALATHAARVRHRQAVAGWLHRVAVRAALDLLDSRGTTRPLPIGDQEPVDSGPDPARVAADRELGRLLDAELNRLPDKLRIPFVLCELQGQSNADAAAVLGCPVGTVESRLSRARRRLRTWLAARGATPASVLPAVPESVRVAMVRAAVPGSAVRSAVRALADRAVRLTLTAKLLSTAVLGGLLAVAVGVALASAAPRPAALKPNATREPKQRFDPEGFPLPAGVVARLGSARLRHGGWISDICFSADGKLIASVGADSAIRVWQANTGKQVFVVRRPSGEFDRVAFSADRKTILVAGHDQARSCDLWRIDAVTGTVTAQIPLPATHPAPAAVRFSSDGTRLAIGSRDTKQVRVIDTATGGTVWTGNLKKETPVGAAFAADGRTIAVSTRGGTVRLFDATGKPAGVLRAVKANLKNVALSPDGKKVVAYDDRGGKLLAWNRSSGKLLWTGSHAAAYSLTFAPDGRTLVPSSYAYTVQTVAAANGKDRVSFAGMVEITAAAFRPDSKVVALGSISGTIGLFDTATGRPLAGSADPPHAVHSIRFSADGKTLYGWAGDWFAWALAGGKQRRITNTHWSYGAPLSPDGKWTARDDFLRQVRHGAAHEQIRLEICDATTGDVKRRCDGKASQGAGWKDFTPDGKVIVAGLYDGTLRAWNIGTGKELLKLPGHRTTSVCHAFSADSRVLVTGAFGDSAEMFPVRVYDLAAGKELGKYNPGLWVVSVSVSGDGRRVAAATSANIGKADPSELTVVWDVASGKELVRLPQHGPGGFVALSPDGRTVAVAHRWKEEVRVWEVASRTERFVFRHEGVITGLVFSPDGRTLAAASKEAPIYLWDVTGDLAGPPPRWEAAAASGLWDDLQSASAARAFAAIRRLRANPAQAVRLLAARTKLSAPDAGTLKRLFTDLDADDFRTREKAMAALAGLGEAIRAALQAEQARTRSIEVRARVRRLLERLTLMTPQRRRLIRAVEAVEGMAAPRARAVLETWASGNGGTTLATEASAALARLRR